MAKFQDLKEEHLPTLKQYVPVVERVHGKDHPEFYDVRKIFDDLVEKLEEKNQEQPDLDKEFESFRKVTDNYTVPEDTCESYEAVYEMLEELDKEYYA